MEKLQEKLILRSLLFVPGHVDRFFTSAQKTSADVLVLDLEDSVPENKKKDARSAVADRVSSCKSIIPLLVRVNSRESGLMEEDLKKVACKEIKGFVFPKVRNAEDIEYMEDILSVIETQKNLIPGKFKILPLIETAEAVLNVYDIAKSSKRIIALIFGHEDFLLDIQGGHVKSADNLLVPRMMIVMAARASGCIPIDTPYLEIKNIEGCAEYAAKSRKFGFFGMLVLHPSQVEPVNKGYTPSEEEIKNAEKITALSEDAKGKGRNIAFSENSFIAPPIVKQAQNLLERSNLIRKEKNRRR